MSQSAAALPDDRRHDLVIIGAGPAGATAALRAARRGLDTVVLEQGRHPRFHIGESLLPRNMTLIRELGLAEPLQALPQTYKIGASFAFGHETGTTDYHFATGLLPVNYETFNIERAPFDRLLCDEARRNGAAIHEGVVVRRILELRENAVAVEAAWPDGRVEVVRGRCLIDASGQGAVVGRHLGTRRLLPDLKKVASYGHFTGVWRPEGVLGGYPQIVMCDEGWFWFIPLDDVRTSIGIVMRQEVTRRIDVPNKKLIFWAIERCPLARKWTAGAVFPEETWVSADFSYTCRPYAGPGYFLAGDAATFIDPIFSTGVCLGMMSAVEAVDTYLAIRSGKIAAVAARRRYHRFVKNSSSSFFRLVRGFYQHSFRELFLHNSGPVEVHRAITSVLTGNVFPAPVWPLRWRFRLFEVAMRLQRVIALVPRRTGWSLIAGAPSRQR